MVSEAVKGPQYNGNSHSIREKLIKARGGKSQADVAAAIGFSQKYLSKLELGQRTPSLKTAIKIAFYYQMGIEELFPDVQKEKCLICDIPSENLIAELKRRGYKVFKEV